MEEILGQANESPPTRQRPVFTEGDVYVVALEEFFIMSSFWKRSQLDQLKAALWKLSGISQQENA